ncbi:MAG: hypothetical protein H0V61_00420 [Chitinophagales bacterium]|nr:hypothetical protein [Chitinophagales bacterium]
MPLLQFHGVFLMKWNFPKNYRFTDSIMYMTFDNKFFNITRLIEIWLMLLTIIYGSFLND